MREGGRSEASSPSDSDLNLPIHTPLIEPQKRLELWVSIKYKYV